MSEELSKAQIRHEQFLTALKPRQVFMVKYDSGEPEVETAVLRAYDIDHAAGATAHACSVRTAGGRNIRCGRDMVYLTADEARHDIVDSIRENLLALLDEQVAQAQRVAAAYRTLRRFEEDLKI